MERAGFQCALCSRLFTSGLGLQQHVRTHTQERPWHCDLCKTSYKTIKGFKDHRLSNHGVRSEGDKVYSCAQCAFKTTTNQALQGHVLSPSKNRPLACKFPGCKSKF